MSQSIHNQNKDFIKHFRQALYNIDQTQLKAQLETFFAEDAVIQLQHPYNQLAHRDALYDEVYHPLLTAIPDLERRDYIVMAGKANGKNWVGCCGYYMGVFEQPWLDIPPTGHLIGMRYHEFFAIDDNKIIEMQALWDIPEVMMQANAWAMTPSLAVEWRVPSPATQDGIITSAYDPTHADSSLKLINDMLADLQHNEQGVEAMNLGLRWHPKFNWYGPAGIGSMRRISGFRNWHQIPFLKAMPNRVGHVDAGVFFADGDYVGFTALPYGMSMTYSGDGWLGIPPNNQQLTMRSLDFWRCEDGLIRENWVLVDILDVYHQMGVDVFARMRELTHMRQRHWSGEAL